MPSERNRPGACSLCRRYKRKCDRNKPACGACACSRNLCVYESPKSRSKTWSTCSMCKLEEKKCDGTKPACRRCTEMGKACVYEFNIQVVSIARPQETSYTHNNQTNQPTAQAQETIYTFDIQTIDTMKRAEGTSNSPRNPKPEQSSNQSDTTMTSTGGHISGTQIAHQEAKQTEGSSIDFPDALLHEAPGRVSPVDPSLNHVNLQPDTMMVHTSPLVVSTMTRNGPSDRMDDILYWASAPNCFIDPAFYLNAMIDGGNFDGVGTTMPGNSYDCVEAGLGYQWFEDI